MRFFEEVAELALCFVVLDWVDAKLEIDEIRFVGCGDLVGGGGGFYRLDERNLKRGWWVGVG